ncbi:hypothetical protein MSPP1_000101 [Malassezia sp. CBS 17886]|nr:hypothetical protein MSPP1_000101 [Malassezia sp. CBS 17886]
MARGQRTTLPTVQATPPIRFAVCGARVDEQIDEVAPTTKVTKAQARRSNSVFSYLSRWFARISIVYLLVAVFWRCPSEPFSFTYNAKHPLLVCREVASAQEQLAPVVAEYGAWAHKIVEPYAGRHLDTAHAMWQRAKPLAHEAFAGAHAIYYERVEPLARGVAKHAHAWSLPHRRTLHGHYKKHLHPHVNQFHSTVKPYADVHRDVAPHVARAIEQAHCASEKASDVYEHEVHPRLKGTLYSTYVYVRHTAFPFAHSRYLTHAHPHLSALFAKLHARIDDLLVKYGWKQRTVLDSFVHKAKETYEHAGLTPSETPAEDAEDSEGLQAKLDAELAMAEDAFGKAEEEMRMVSNRWRDVVEERIIALRRRNVAEFPDRFAQIIDAGIDNGIAPVLYRALRQMKSLALETLGDDGTTTEAWRTQSHQLFVRLLNEFLESYQNTRAALARAVDDREEKERSIINEAVTDIRKLSQQCVLLFNDFMEQADFQVTFYENEGWDAAMKKRGRFFRDDMKERLEEVTSAGEERKSGASDVNFAAEQQTVLSSLNKLFWEAEQSFTDLCERVKGDPSVLFAKADAGRLLVDLHEHVDLLHALGRKTTDELAKRLAQDVATARKALGSEAEKEPTATPAPTEEARVPEETADARLGDGTAFSDDAAATPSTGEITVDEFDATHATPEKGDVEHASGGAQDAGRDAADAVIDALQRGRAQGGEKTEERADYAPETGETSAYAPETEEPAVYTPETEEPAIYAPETEEPAVYAPDEDPAGHLPETEVPAVSAQHHDQPLHSSEAPETPPFRGSLHDEL